MNSSSANLLWLILHASRSRCIASQSQQMSSQLQGGFHCTVIACGCLTFFCSTSLTTGSDVTSFQLLEYGDQLNPSIRIGEFLLVLQNGGNPEPAVAALSKLMNGLNNHGLACHKQNCWMPSMRITGLSQPCHLTSCLGISSFSTPFSYFAEILGRSALSGRRRRLCAKVEDRSTLSTSTTSQSGHSGQPCKGRQVDKERCSAVACQTLFSRDGSPDDLLMLRSLISDASPQIYQANRGGTDAYLCHLTPSSSFFSSL